MFNISYVLIKGHTLCKCGAIVKDFTFHLGGEKPKSSNLQPRARWAKALN